MGLLGIIGLIGTAVQVAGAVTGFIGRQQIVKGNIQQIEATKKSEAIRKRQLELDVSRRRRDLIRQAIVLRSQALTTAFSQGAGKGSGVQGGIAQITGEQNLELQRTLQNFNLGLGIFRSNEDYLAGQLVSAKGGATVNVGEGLSSLGGAVINAAPALTRLGGTNSNG